MWNLALIGQVVSKEKTFETFSLSESCKTSDPPGGATLDPRVIIWTIFVNVHKIKLYIKYQGLLVWEKTLLKIFSTGAYFYSSLCNKIWPFRKKGQSQSKVIIFFILYYAPNVAYQAPRSLALWFRRRRILKGFYYVWMWRPYWTCARYGKQTFLRPTHWGTICEIWLWLALWFMRIRHLKNFSYMSLCKASDPWGGVIFYTQCCNLNSLRRG